LLFQRRLKRKSGSAAIQHGLLIHRQDVTVTKWRSPRPFGATPSSNQRVTHVVVCLAAGPVGVAETRQFGRRVLVLN
jgi:hypothetical protein